MQHENYRNMDNSASLRFARTSHLVFSIEAPASPSNRYNGHNNHKQFELRNPNSSSRHTKELALLMLANQGLVVLYSMLAYDTTGQSKWQQFDSQLETMSRPVQTDAKNNQDPS